MVYVLDACALIALLNEEEGYDNVDNLFHKAVAGNVSLYMSIINLIEVLYNYYRDEGPIKVSEIMTKVRLTPLNIISVISPAVCNEAYRLKGTYKISLADAIGAATAKEFSAQFVTSAHSELEPIEQHEPISFLWLPARPKK